MIYTIPHIIRRNAQTDPDKTAFRFDEKDLSYVSLWAKANQLAATLAQHGVERGDRVGTTCTNRLRRPFRFTASAGWGSVCPARSTHAL